ncbi:MAG TPA: phytanoyl-CoA dioxygenase family protein [Longimicrobium sp.]
MRPTDDIVAAYHGHGFAQTPLLTPADLRALIADDAQALQIGRLVRRRLRPLRAAERRRRHAFTGMHNPLDDPDATPDHDRDDPGHPDARSLGGPAERGPQRLALLRLPDFAAFSLCTRALATRPEILEVASTLLGAPAAMASANLRAIPPSWPANAAWAVPPHQRAILDQIPQRTGDKDPTHRTAWPRAGHGAADADTTTAASSGWGEEWWDVRTAASRSITMMIGLDASTMDNGCMLVAPDSHRGGLRPHYTGPHHPTGPRLASPSDVVTGAADEVGGVEWDIPWVPDVTWARERITALQLEPGWAVIAHPLLLHAHAPNTTRNANRHLFMTFTTT